MSDHPEICDFYFVRHAPVVKRDGHVPPADPPIQTGDYALDRLTRLLPNQAAWHVSPLLRARQTADLLAQSCTPSSRVEDAALAEMDFGDWQDQPVATVWDAVSGGPLHNWSFVTPDTEPPGGESFAATSARVAGWMDSQTACFSTTPRVVVCHGGVMRAVLAAALGAPLSQVIGVPVPHFGLLRLTLMDPARATHDGGAWLFGGLTDTQVCRPQSG